MARSFFLLALVINALCYVFAEIQETECDQAGEEIIQKANAAFTGKLFYEAVKAAPTENCIMSAYSVFTPLAQLALYAEGDTLHQLLRTLNMPDKSYIRSVFPKLISKLRAEQNVVLNVASRIFATDEYPLTKGFLNDTKQVFDAEAESVNFLEAQQAADTINRWVEGQTNKRIKDIASPDMFDEGTRLVLANAIYFLGNWAIPFDKDKTMVRPFTNSNKTVDTPTMYRKRPFKYAENDSLDCKVLEMYYKGFNFSFVVFLPNKIDGLVDLVDKLQDSDKFYGAYRATNSEEVHVYLPKMKIESVHNLIPILESTGITDVFDRTKSSLKDILEVYKPLYVSSAKQKAFVQVDETGTEAAAANFFGVSYGVSFRPPKPVYEFKADHPFAFYIMNKENIIFSGTFATKGPMEEGKCVI